jgi:hypothetical protein
MVRAVGVVLLCVRITIVNYRITRGVRNQKKPFSESKYSKGLAGA